MWLRSLSLLARQNKPLQKPTILYFSKSEGISNLEIWVNVLSLLQTTVHRCLEDGELFLSSVVYSKYPVWVFVDTNDSDWLRLSLKCLVMKVGSVMMESQDLEMHLNLVKDFTGSWPRMSSTTSFWTRSPIVVAVWDITKGPRFWGFRGLECKMKSKSAMCVCVIGRRKRVQKNKDGD